MKRKVLAMLMAAVMLVPTLSACGGADGGNESKESDAKVEDSASGDEESSDGEEVTLTIWDWDEAHLNHMTEWYHNKYPNVNFETLVVSTQDYMQKLQSALASGSGVPDIILSEMAYRGKVFELGITEDLSKDPYNVKAEDMFDFANQLGAGPNGELYGVEQQICPSGFAYRRDLAKEYLGTDDPAEVGAMISDWDKMFEVATQVKEKSGGKVTALAGVTMLNAVLMNQNVSDYIDGDNIDLTGRYKEAFDILTKFNQAGVLGKQEDNTPALNSSYAAGEVIFYPCAPWSCKWGIATNDPDGSGNWGLTTAPGDGYTYGGTSVSIYSGSENKEEAWKYIQEVYCTGEGVEEAFKQFGFMTGFKAPYEDENSYFFTEKGQYDEFFGGQNLADYFINTIAIKTVGQVQTKNEANVRTALTAVLAQAAADTSMTTDDLLEALKTETQTLIPTATLK
ncbi:MAG: extracellular solute-binding protein [Clostridiales bacterium]|nr:extracellular solute-binding protein [Clostridiales bacterium]